MILLAEREPQAVLRRWGRFGAHPQCDWRPARRMVEAARALEVVHLATLGEALRRSAARFAPLDDPLTLDLSTVGLGLCTREESWSDWLAWVLRTIGEPREVLEILGVTSASSEPLGGSSGDRSVDVFRERSVAHGHDGSAGRVDVWVAAPGLDVLVELKLGDADEADTAKGAGYARSEPDAAAVLIALDGSQETYEGGFRLLRWRDLCVALRQRAPAWIETRGPLTVGLILNFAGAVEQQLLGLPGGLGRVTVGGFAAAAAAEHIRAGGSGCGGNDG